MVAAHELGHAFGLQHDFRGPTYLMSYREGRNQLSSCAADWLNVHRYFNRTDTGNASQIEFNMLQPSLVSFPNTVRLRFSITNNDSAKSHQVILEIRNSRKSSGYGSRLLDCKSLDERTETIEFIIELPYRTERVHLSIIDASGFMRWQSFPIDTAVLFTDPEPIFIPDTNVAAAVREALELAPGSSITQYDMLDLHELFIPDQQEINLTGINRATHLKKLAFGGQISDITPLAGLTQLRSLALGSNQISDITPLAGLTQLSVLDLAWNQISDITPLAGLTQLSVLDLSSNLFISDITPLAGLTQLRTLYLANHFSISDITPLAGLTQLRILNLHNNEISDITPLAGLTQLRILNLHNNEISDITPLAGLTQLRILNLVSNPIKNKKPLLALLRKNRDIKIYIKDNETPLPVSLSFFRPIRENDKVVIQWTTESELDNAGFNILRRVFFRTQTGSLGYKEETFSIRNGIRVS